MRFTNTSEHAIRPIFVLRFYCNRSRALISTPSYRFMPTKYTCTVITSSRYSVTGNARPPIPAVLLVLYVTTIRQTVRYTQRPVWLKICAIRITLYPFPTPYNGFFTGFLRFSKKIQIQFSPERVLRQPQLKLISSNETGGYKRLLFWSYGFWFEILGTPPTESL